MRMHLIAASVLICLSASACKKDEAAAKPAADKAPAVDKKPEPPPPAKLAPDFAAWDAAGKKKAWVGSWVVKDNGSFQAWTVGEGGQVQVREGEKDSSYMLEVEIPCYAYFDDNGMKFPHPFTVTADGKLRSSGSGGGYRKGAEAIFCDASSTVYVLGADGKCTAWKNEFEWKKSDAECSLGKDAEGKDVFKHGEPNGGEFVIEGDAIIGGKYPAEAATDHEAAKTAAAAKNAAK